MIVRSIMRVILSRMSVLLILALIPIAIAVFQLINLAGQIAKYQSYWNDQNGRPAPGDAITYVALGDSTAQSIGASAPSKGYVGLLKAAIEDKTRRPVRLINLSKSGAKVRDVIDDQLPQMADYDIPPDAIITMEIGANDVVRDFDVIGFEKDMSDLLPLLPGGVIMSDLPSFKRTRLNQLDKKIIEANDTLKILADKHNIRLVPLYKFTSERASWRNNAIDIFHPNDRGYRNWYDAFWQTLETKL